MKEPHGESLANYADLESCAGGGDAAGEALPPRCRRPFPSVRFAASHPR